MDLHKLWQLVVRRKVVVLVMLGLSAAVLVYTYASAPPLYRSGGSMVLFNPPQAPDERDGTTSSSTSATTTSPDGFTPTTQVGENPYARFNDLSIFSDVVVRVMNSPAVAENLKAAGLEGAYTIGANIDFYRGPIIDLAGEGATPEQAKKVVNLVMAELEKQVVRLQDQRGVDPSYRITTGVVVPPERATRVFSSTLRRLIGMAALCFAATVAMALLLDSFGPWRHRPRRATADGTEPVDQPDTDEMPEATPAAATPGGVGPGPPGSNAHRGTNGSPPLPSRREAARLVRADPASMFGRPGDPGSPTQPGDRPGSTTSGGPTGDP